MPTTLRLPAVRCLVMAFLLISLPGLLSQPVRAVHAASLAPSATITVTNCNDNGAGSLRDAIQRASPGDTITFSVSCTGSNAIKLTSTLNISTNNLTVDGSGQSVTLDGQHSVQVLQVNIGITFTLNALTIANGSSLSGGGGLRAITGSTVNISNSTFTNNFAFFGGGLSSFGTITISNSTFANNSAGNGAGLFNNGGTTTVSNSTFANNSASHGGGGLLNYVGSTTTISNSTFAYNSSPTGGGLLNYAGSTTTISKSIVANNTSNNCFGGITDGGYNLESGTDCGIQATNHSMQNTDPLLGPLANNGGPTQTLALHNGSPAINKIPAGPGGACSVTTDQRGVSRPQGPACGIGAFEFRVPTLTLPSSPITVQATSPQGAVVTYSVMGSLPDDPSSQPTVSCTPLSGSTFPIGTTTVQCQASDQANPPDVTTGSFQVIVHSAQPPVLHLPPAITVNTVNATSPQGAVVTYSVTATDPVSPSNQLSVTCTPPSGSVFPIGTTTVQCSATNQAGQRTSATFTVTVVDRLSPVLHLPPAITVQATSPQGAVVTYTVTASDPVYPSNQLTMVCTPPSGSVFPIGTTTVQCSATNPAGLRTSGTFTVTVEGPYSPSGLGYGPEGPYGPGYEPEGPHHHPERPHGPRRRPARPQRHWR